MNSAGAAFYVFKLMRFATRQENVIRRPQKRGNAAFFYFLTENAYVAKKRYACPLSYTEDPYFA